MKSKSVIVFLLVTLLSNCDKENIKYTDLIFMSRLERTIISNNFEQVSTLIESGYDINRQNRKGYIPIWIAINYSRWDIVELLLQSGSKRHFSFYTDDIGENSSRDVLKELLRRNRKDIVNRFIEYEFRKEGQVFHYLDIIDSATFLSLINKGLDLTVMSSITNLRGDVVRRLTYLDDALNLRRYDLALIIIENSNLREFKPEVLLEISNWSLSSSIELEKSLYKLTEYILKSGSEILLINQFGITVLDFAIGHGHYYMVKALLENGIAYDRNDIKKKIKQYRENSETDIDPSYYFFNKNQSHQSERLDELYEMTLALLEQYIE